MEKRGATWNAFELAELVGEAARSPKAYLEFLRHGAMSAGIYRLAAGTVDRQQPHLQDELYYVIEGRSRFFVDGADLAVGPGSLLYVEAHAEHRFHGIEEDLTVLVIFAPAEESPGPRPSP
jgi:mannose-6-phosphate isomerase-like protein (cupin superfamily)